MIDKDEMNHENIVYAVGDARISSVKQGLMGDSHDDQRVQIEIRVKQLSAIKGEKIVIRKWFEFTQSASGEYDTQPILEALEYCKNPKNKVKYLFIKSIDRGTRGGGAMWERLKAEFSKLGIQMVDCYGVIGQTEVNTLEHLGVEFKWSKFNPSWITELLEAERAKGEVRDILTRMIGAEVNYVRMGYRVRQAPYGYKNFKKVTENGTRTILVPQEENNERFFVERMFELRAQGNLPDDEIVKTINDMGFKTRIRLKRSKTDRNKIIGTSGQVPLSVKQLDVFVRNPIYCGVNAEKWTNGKPLLCKFDGFISVDLYNKANRGKRYLTIVGDEPVLTKKSIPEWRVIKGMYEDVYAYKKYVLCPICKHPLKASAPKNKRKVPCPRYHCSLGHKYYEIPLKAFNNTIDEFCKNLHFTDEFKAKFIKVFLEEWEKRKSSTQDDSMKSEEHVLELKAKVKQISDVMENLTTKSAIQEFEGKLEKAKLNLANAINKRDNHEDKEVKIETLVNSAKYYMEHLKDLLLGSTNPQQNAAMFGTVFATTPTYEDLKNGTPQLAPIFELNKAFEVSEKQCVTPLEFESKFPE